MPRTANWKDCWHVPVRLVPRSSGSCANGRRWGRSAGPDAPALPGGGHQRCRASGGTRYLAEMHRLILGLHAPDGSRIGEPLSSMSPIDPDALDQADMARLRAGHDPCAQCPDGPACRGALCFMSVGGDDDTANDLSQGHSSSGFTRSGRRFRRASGFPPGCLPSPRTSPAII